MTKKHQHYYKSVSGLQTIDVYRVLRLFEVTDPCIQHAIKKLLCAGGRGAKDIKKDIEEAVDTLERFLDMRAEDSRATEEQWPADDSRIDAIGQNGPTGEHYQAWRKCTGFPPEEALGSMVDARFEDGTAFFDVPCSSVSWGRATEWRPAK